MQFFDLFHAGQLDTAFDVSVTKEHLRQFVVHETVRRELKKYRDLKARRSSLQARGPRSDINRGYYSVARRYEFYFRVAKQYFTNELSE